MAQQESQFGRGLEQEGEALDVERLQLEQQRDQFAERLGLDRDQLSQQDRQFVDKMAEQSSQFELSQAQQASQFAESSETGESQFEKIFEREGERQPQQDQFTGAGLALQIKESDTLNDAEKERMMLFLENQGFGGFRGGDTLDLPDGGILNVRGLEPDKLGTLSLNLKSGDWVVAENGDVVAAEGRGKIYSKAQLEGTS